MPSLCCGAPARARGMGRTELPRWAPHSVRATSPALWDFGERWSFCGKPGQEKPRSPLIPLHDRFWRGYPARGPQGGCEEAAMGWHAVPGASSPQKWAQTAFGQGWDRSHSPTGATEGWTPQMGPCKATKCLLGVVLRAPRPLERVAGVWQGLGHQRWAEASPPADPEPMGAGTESL